MTTDKRFHIYRSSAGSGKTYTLVRTYLSLLLKTPSDTKFKHVLAVTFTNKAADEMKERVLNALKKLNQQADTELLKDYTEYTGLSSDYIVEKSGKLLTKILHNYGDFHILTIDKFIHRVIRSFARELGLSNSFEVESDNGLFLQQSIELLLENLGKKGNENITGYLEGYYESMLLEGEKTDVSKSLFDLKGLIFAENSKSDIEQLVDYDLEWFKSAENSIKERAKLVRKGFLNSINEIISILESNGIDKYSFSGGVNKGWNLFIRNILDGEEYKVSNDRFKNLQKSLNDLKYYTKKTESAFMQVKEPLEKQMQLSLDYFDEIGSLEYILKKFPIYSLIGTLSNKINDVKKSNNLVFLSEFNQMITEIVVNESAPFIYERIGTRFSNFLVDEFQDTSKLQWQNLVPLFYNSLGEGNENLIVGDAKQAIYRWRGGDVRQFITLPKVTNEFSYSTSINSLFESSKDLQMLEDNYRSSKSVVEFNNALFTALGENTNSKLVREVYTSKNVHQNVKSKKVGYVEFRILSDEEGKRLNSAEFNDLALSLMIQQIEESLADGYNYGDLAVLIRSKKEGKLIAQQLDHHEIPYVSSDAVLLKGSDDVQFIMDLMRLLSGSNSIPIFAKVLTYLSNENSHVSNFDTYRKPKDKVEYTDSIYLDLFFEKEAKSFDFKKYEQLNLYAKTIYLIEQFNLSSYSPHLEMLLSTVLSYEQINGANEIGFIEYFDGKGGETVVNLGHYNKLQLMTIHKSKGLEFPVVFMPFCNWKNKNNSFVEYEWVQTQFIKDLNLPNYTVAKSKSVSKSITGDLMDREEEAIELDNINLYYVGFTRPVDRLYALISNEGKNVTGIIAEQIEKLPILEKKDGFYCLGEKQKVNKKEIVSSELKKGTTFIDWTDKLGISVNLDAYNQKIEEDSFNLSERMIGVIVHEVLSEVYSIEGLSNVVESKALQYEISNNDIDVVRSIVLQILTLPKYQELLSESIEVNSEMEILDEVGGIHRPDKVFELENEVFVVDFKIGSPQKKYERQVATYKELLEDLYQKKVKGILLFASENFAEMIEV